MGRLCADLSAASGTPAAAAAPDHPAALTADDSVGAAPTDAAGSRFVGVTSAATVAATVHALRSSSAQVCLCVFYLENALLVSSI